MYGSDGPCEEDAVNCAWRVVATARAAVNTVVDFSIGATGQFFWDQTVGLPSLLGYQVRDESEAMHNGRVAGQDLSTVFNSAAALQGIIDLGTGMTGGAASAACEVFTVGACTLVAAPAGGVSLGLILKGGLEATIGGAVVAHNKINPLYMSASGGQSGSSLPGSWAPRQLGASGAAYEECIFDLDTGRRCFAPTTPITLRVCLATKNGP